MAKVGVLTTSDYLPIEAFERLLEGLHRDKKYVWELFCSIAFATALRVSDVRSTKWVDVLGKDDFFKKEKKTKKTRHISVDTTVRDRISELYVIMGSPDKSQPVICNQKTETSFTTQYINRTLKKFRVKYQLPIKAFSTHTFRKTFGRYIYDTAQDKTEALVLLNRIFNHTSIETTMVYIGLRQDDMNKAYRSIKFKSYDETVNRSGTHTDDFTE